MSDFIQEYEIYDVPGFKAQVAKLSKKYKVEISCVYGDVQDRKYETDEIVIDYQITPVTATFSFEGYKVEGFDYFGCIKDDGFGLMSIHGSGSMDGKSVIDFINELKAIPCHNCGRKHIRKIGHVFQVQENGEFVIFGSTCAKNYFGVDFKKILSFFEKFDAIVRDMDNQSISNSFVDSFDANRVARIVYFLIKAYGFISKTQAEVNDYEPTADIARECLFVPKELAIIIKDNKELWKELEEKDFSAITEFEIDGSTEFGHNVKMIQKKFENGYIKSRDIGIFAWLVSKVYFSAPKKEKIDFILPDLEKGDKLANLEVELVSVHNYTNQYGVQNIYTFIDKDAKVRYKWFSSVNIQADIDTALIITRATVKGTEDNEYGKSVIITRAKVKEV